MSRRRDKKESHLMFTDRSLTCADCGQEFSFVASEQAFYSERGFSDPRRCGSCRAARKLSSGNGSAGGGYGDRSGGGGGYSRGPREMFSATCSSCGKDAQVPFRPTSGKPVYCSDCFRR
jgi:CxxC-x17-CxxC domain-containing protein